MTQEEKDLLLKDLCARLPYGVKCYKSTYRPELTEEVICMLRNGSHHCVQLGTFLYKLEHIKPYLFPFSSMTIEQKEEERSIKEESYYSFDANGNIYTLQDFYNKNHIDYRGLIPMGLAIDCTNLNIY